MWCLMPDIVAQADVLMDKRIVVVMDGWEADSMFPQVCLVMLPFGLSSPLCSQAISVHLQLPHVSQTPGAQAACMARCQI